MKKHKEPHKPSRIYLETKWSKKFVKHPFVFASYPRYHPTVLAVQCILHNAYSQVYEYDLYLHGKIEIPQQGVIGRYLLMWPLTPQNEVSKAVTCLFLFISYFNCHLKKFNLTSQDVLWRPEKMNFISWCLEVIRKGLSNNR